MIFFSLFPFSNNNNFNAQLTIYSIDKTNITSPRINYKFYRYLFNIYVTLLTSNNIIV